MSHSDLALKMKERTRDFALSILRMAENMQRGTQAEILKKQIMRSGTSIGANYRAVCRARSRADFIAKMKVVVEEADETQYWLELLRELELIDKEQFNALNNEAQQLVAIFVKSVKTAQEKI